MPLSTPDADAVPATPVADPALLSSRERYAAVVELWATALFRLHAKGRLPPSPMLSGRSEKVNPAE